MKFSFDFVKGLMTGKSLGALKLKMLCYSEEHFLL
jgi:hypothetical protein